MSRQPGPIGGGFHCSSKLLQKKWMAKSYRKHQEKLHAVKSSLDTTSPKRYSHMVLKLKKVQKEEERQQHIDHENKLLLEKMSHIMQHPGQVDNWNDYETKSLNHPHRERELEKIAQQNMGLARRLECVRPKYDVREWEEDYKKHEDFKERWAESTKDYEMFSPRPTKPRRENVSGNQKGQKEEEEGEDGSDVEEDSEGDKLPKIEVKEKKTDLKSDSKKDSQVTKLPKIKSQKDTIAEADARLLFKACKNLAKPNDIVIKTLIRRSHSQRLHTKKQFEESFELDLESELTGAMGQEYQYIILALLADREARDVEAIHKTIESDQPAKLVDLLCTRNSSAFTSINKQYQNVYGNSIEDDILTRIKDPDCQQFLLALIQGGKQDSYDVDEDLAKKDAQEILEAGDSAFAGNDSKLITLVGEKNLAQLRATILAYKTVSEGTDITQAMKDASCSKQYIDCISTLNQSLSVGPATYAEKIHSNLKPRNSELVESLLSGSEVDMPMIRKAYKKKYGQELIDDLLAKCGAGPGRLLAEMAAKTPPASAQKTKQDTQKGKKPANQGAQRKSPVKTPVSSKASKSPHANSGKKTAPGLQQKTGTSTSLQSKDSRKTDQTSNKGTPSATKKAPGSPQKTGTSTSLKNKESKKAESPKEDEPDKNATTDANKEASQEPSNQDKQASPEPSNQDKQASPEPINQEKQATPEPSNEEKDELQEAIDCWNSDQEPLTNILCGKNNEERQQLQQQYQEKHSKDLIDELKSKLPSDCEETIQGLMLTPAQYDVHCLHRAMDSGTEGHAILVDILCTRSTEEQKAIMTSYKDTHQKDLIEALRAHGDVASLLADRLQNPVDAAVDTTLATEDAQKLHSKTEGSIDVTSESFKDLVTKRSSAQFKATGEEYQKLSGKSLEDAIKASNLGDKEKGYVALVKALQDPVDINAAQLDSNPEEMTRIVISRAETDLPAIKAKYQELNGKSVEDVINQGSGGNKKLLLELIKGK